MPSQDKTTDMSWQKIATKMTHEQDSDKLLALAKELDAVLQKQERDKARKRLRLDKTA